MTDLRGVTWDHVRGWGGLRAAADAYAESLPDVRVTWETRSLQAFADQPLDQLSGYDLIVLDHPSIGAAVAQGALVSMDEHLEGAFLEGLATSSVGRSFESYTWEGHVWALPVDAAAQVAAYRPDLLDRVGVDVPRTWDDVMRVAAALRSRAMWIAMAAIPVDVVCAFLGTCAAAGGRPFDEERVVDRAVGREALAILRTVMETAHPQSVVWNPPRLFASMSEHDDIAYCPLAFGYVNFARAGFAAEPLRFAPGPTMKGGATPSGTLGGAGIAVSSGSGNVEEACEHAAFVCSAEVQRAVYVDGGGQPGHRAAWTDREADAAANGFFSKTLPALDAAYLRPRYDGFLGFQETAGDLVHRFLRDGGDAEAVLDDLDEAYRASRMTGVER
jgi:multiple sugar transport system substrate-binding protein